MAQRARTPGRTCQHWHRANLCQGAILVSLVFSLLFLAACSGVSVPGSSSSSPGVVAKASLSR